MSRKHKTYAEKILPALAAKRAARLQYLSCSTSENEAACKQSKNMVQHLTQEAMQKYWSELCTRIEAHALSGNIH